MSSGEFLVGSGNPEATVIRDRMEAQIEIATQHSDYLSVTAFPDFLKGDFLSSESMGLAAVFCGVCLQLITHLDA